MWDLASPVRTIEQYFGYKAAERHEELIGSSCYVMLEPSGVDASLCCEHCSYRAVWPFQLEHHGQRNQGHSYAGRLFHAATKLGLYNCACCNYKTCFKLSLYRHCVTKHAIANFLKAKTGPSDEKFNGFLCDRCAFNGNSSLLFLQHQNSPSNHSATAIETDEAPQHLTLDHPYAAQDVIFIKTESNPQGSGSEAEETPWFECDQCLYLSKKKGLLSRHMRMMHANEVRWFDCAVCSYRTRWYGGLKVHMVKHMPTGEITWFNCPECPYRARLASALKRHMWHHTDDDPFACFNCKQTPLRSEDDWRLLMEAEMLEWFGCIKCPHRAISKANLKVHIRTKHMGACPCKGWFRCSECSFRSKTIGILKHHLPLHVDLFCCARCSYRAREEKLFQRHVQSHRHGARLDSSVDSFDFSRIIIPSSSNETSGTFLKTHMRQRMLELLKSNSPGLGRPPDTVL